jgi:hypothetical protein
VQVLHTRRKGIGNLDRVAAKQESVALDSRGLAEKIIVYGLGSGSKAKQLQPLIHSKRDLIGSVSEVCRDK